MKLVPLRYRLSIAALYPLLAAFSLWQAWQCRSLRFARQRLGSAYPTPNAAPLWLHCASVGEVRAALPLIDALRADPRFAPVLVSTATPTGAEALAQQNWPEVQHVYLPLDTQSAVKRAFGRLKPRALLIMETELWPNLIERAHQSNIPALIINARLSPRTLSAPRWLRPVYRHALSRLTCLLCKSPQDAANFERLGAKPEQLRTLGNLKFAASAQTAKPPAAPLSRPFWLAASTHEDEEQQLCRALLAQACAPSLLVIAPRHPKRSAKIQAQLQALSIDFAVRSLDQRVSDTTQVYLADTLGEMPLWLHHAQLVFMGGSLVPVGGHNVLEAAAAGAAQICGPQYHNFDAEVQLLRDAEALWLAADAEQVLAQVQQLLTDQPGRAAMGARGRHAVTELADVLPRYLDALSPLIARDQ